MLPHHSQYDIYDYIIDNVALLRIKTIFAILAIFMATIGNVVFYIENPLIGLLFAPFTTFMFVMLLISSYILLHYKKFSRYEHAMKCYEYWARNIIIPKVDIFLPVCGEDKITLRNTWQGVSELTYLRKESVTVYVLDDKNDPDLAVMADEFGFKYLSRPDRGYMKKAGNLKYGFEHSNGDFIAIFDADFRPHPDFLMMTIPYMEEKSIGIVQTPQFFHADKELHSKSLLEYGACVVQEDFYRIIQHARNHFQGSICVGSNALYRRSALEKVGGTAQVEHSEDVHTGFSLIPYGYKVFYLPVILASGLCPDKYEPFFKQQNRWASGSLSLFRSKTFWQTKLPIMTRLSYLSGMMYYVTNAVKFILPFQLYTAIWIYSDQLYWTNSLIFIPAILFGFIVYPLYRIRPLRLGGIFVHMSQMYFYAYSVILKLVFNTQLGWMPTGGKQKTSPELLNVLIFSVCYSLLLAIGTVILFINNKIHLNDGNGYFLYFWLIFNVLLHAFYWVTAFKQLYTFKIPVPRFQFLIDTKRMS